MAPLAKSIGLLAVCVLLVMVKTGVILRLLPDCVTELARFKSNPMDMGVLPTVTGVPNVTFPVIGPEMVLWTTDFVVGSMYITDAEPIVMLAPVEVPCGMLIRVSGCMLPIRCIISVGVEVETTVVVPFAPVSVMEVMFIEKASIQSAGLSPMFIWTLVVAAVVVLVVELPAELPLQPSRTETTGSAAHRRSAQTAFRGTEMDVENDLMIDS